MGSTSPPPYPRTPRPLSSSLLDRIPASMSSRRGFRGAMVVTVLVVVAFLTLRSDGGIAKRPQRIQNSSAQQGVQTRNTVVKLDESMPFTTYMGGPAGYSVFSDLYLFAGALTAVSPDAAAAARIPKPRRVMSGPKPKTGGAPPAGEDRWTQIRDQELVAAQLGTRAIRLPGVTYIFNDPPGTAGFMAFYEHFVSEIFVPASRVIASTADEAGEYNDPRDLLPTRIIFPRCPADPSWRDDKGGNWWLLQHTLPDVIIEDATQWNDRAASDIAYVFDKVIIVDRSSAHSDMGVNGKWGKMNMVVPSVPAPTHFWDPFRENVLATIGDDPMSHVGKYQLPVVVYIERRSTPMLSPASHDALVNGLKRLTKRAEIHVADLRSMTKQQRISLLSRASILVGLTGDDLFESMWVPPGNGAMVIEMFEEGGFQRDSEAFITMLGLEHMVVQHNQVLTESMWRQLPRKRGKQKDGEIDVDGALVARMVDIQLDRVKAPKA